MAKVRTPPHRKDPTPVAGMKASDQSVGRVPLEPATAVPPANSAGTTASLWERLRPSPDDLKVAGGVLAIAVIFFTYLWMLAPERSFHADELTNLHMHSLREKGLNAEPQHRHFHEFYAFWISERFDETFARIPAMTTVTLGMISLAFLAWRLLGRRAAVIAALVYLLWPRAWDDGLEMRYYGLIFLSATLGLHALLFVRRGAIVLPMAVLAVLFHYTYLWHPTAIPWHGGTLALAMLVIFAVGIDNLLEWRRAPEPRPRLPFLDIALRLGVLIIGVLGVVKFAPVFLATKDGKAALLNLQNPLKLDLEFFQLYRWVFRWVADQFHPHPELVALLSISFPLAIFLGVVVLLRKQPFLLLAAVLLFMMQIYAAGLFRLSWRGLAQSTKYLTSSSVIVVIALVAVIDLAVRWLNTSKRHDRWVPIAALALLVLLPIVPRTMTSAYGDASNYRPFWKEIIARSGDKTPTVLAVGELIQSHKMYHFLLDDFQIHSFHKESISVPTIPALLSRDNPLFMGVHPRNTPEIVKSGLFVKARSLPSNFSQRWDLELIVPTANVNLAGGASSYLNEGQTVAFLEDGDWVLVGGSARLGGRQIEEGRVASFIANSVYPITDVTGSPRIVPAFRAGAIRRRGGFANTGPMNYTNRPWQHPDGPWYQLAAVQEVSYRLYVPEDTRTLALRFGYDEPDRGSFFVKINERLSGLYTDIHGTRAEDERFYDIFLPMPEDLLDSEITVSVCYLSENSHRKPNSEEVRILPIHEVRLEQLEPLTWSTNQIASMRFPPAPQWARNGYVDFTRPGTELLLNPADNPPPDIRPILENTSNGLRMWLPRDMQDQLMAFPPIAVEPGHAVCVEMEARALNMIRKSVVPVLSYFREDLSSIHQGQLSLDYFTSENPTWSTRTFLDVAPKEAAWAVIAFYINSPEGMMLRDDSHFELRKMSILSGSLPPQLSWTAPLPTAVRSQ